MSADRNAARDRPRVVSHLVVRGAKEAIAFYERAFGAEEVMRMSSPDGNLVMHATLKFGDSLIYLCDEMPGAEGPLSPESVGGTTVTLNLWSSDADADYERAIGAGAIASMPLTDAFWGDRYGQVTDPFGHRWAIAMPLREMTPEEVGLAAKAYFSEGEGG